MDKLSDYFTILKLIEIARSGRGGIAGEMNRYLDPSIYNQGLSTNMLRGSGGTGGAGDVVYKSGPSEGVSSNKRNPKKAGMEYMSDGGEAEKEYLYGVGPEGSGIGQLLSPLLPVRREVIEPYQETFSESYVGPDGQIYVDRTVTPGQYGEPEFAAPQAISVLSEVPGMIAEGIASLPETLQNIDIPQAVEQFKRRALISSQAALEGKEKVYDPQTGTLVDSSEALLGAPMLNAPGTAISIARAGDAGGTVLGIMGGTRAKSGKKTKRQVDELRKKGLEGQDLWDAQSGRKNRGYYAESDGQFRFEIDTSDAKFAVIRPEDIKPFTGTNLEDVLDFPQLYEEYPDLKKLKVTRLTPAAGRSVYLEARYGVESDEIKLGVDPEKGLDKPTLAALLHEVQHAVQKREGFEQGASSIFLYPSLDDARITFYEEQKNLIDNATVELSRKLSEEAQSTLPLLSNEVAKAQDARMGLQQAPISRLQTAVSRVFGIEGFGLDVSDIRKIAEFSKYSPEQRELAIDALAEKYKGRTDTRGNEYTRGSMETAVNKVQNIIKEEFGDVDKMLMVREAIEEFLPRFHSIEKGARDIAEMSMESGKAYLRVPGEVEARTVESTYLGQKGAGRDVYPTLRTEEYNPERALDPGQYIYPVGDRSRSVPSPSNQSSVKDKAIAGSLGAAATLGAGATASKIREEEEEPTRRRLTEEEIRAGRIPLEAAMGGGVASMAPVARNMFRGYDIRRGVGAYAPYTRSA
jgi:hypothetical protein